MFDVVAIEDSQFDGTADTIVGTKGSTFGCQPFTVDIGAYGVVVEVELHVYQLIAHHVHVALQDDRLAVLVAWRGWFAYDDVARLVDLGVESSAFAPLLQILNHFLLAFRRAGNLVDLRKLFEDNSRFQFVLVHCLGF